MHLTPRLLAVLLCGAALCACSTTSDMAALTGHDKKTAEKDAAETFLKTPATDLEGGVRQAQLLRLAGRYDEAIRTLSQLMLVASDDPRVVGEYGKTLAEKGRAQDAVDFLKRATELSPNDWSVYSAMGVAYDQLGNQEAARAAYEHALALRPGEPSVLNNYALSRMLADDADTARVLMGRAHIAGGDNDPKIARNIELIRKLTPAPDAPPPAPQDSLRALAYAVKKPAPSTAPAMSAPVLAPAIVPTSAPRPLVQSMPPVAQQMPQQMNPPQQLARVNNPPRIGAGVVMQAVPFDPLAGPVQKSAHAAAQPAPVATRAPQPLVKMAQTTKPAPLKTEKVKTEPVKTATAKTEPTKAEPAKANPPKPAAKAAAAPPAPAPVKPLVKPAPVKTAARKDGVPALRMTADARSASGF